MEHSPVIDPIQIEEKKPHKTEYYRAKNMLYELAASLGCSFDSSEELIFERIEDARVFVDLAAEIGLVYTGTVDVVSSDYDYNWGRVVINLPLLVLVGNSKGEEMKKTIILALLLAFACPAFADTQCGNWLGNTGCRNETGNTWRGSTDSFGNEFWTDNRGNTVRGYTDSFGNKTYYDNRGRTIRCYTDSFGTTTCR